MPSGVEGQMLNAEYVTIMMVGDKRTTHRSATTPIVLVLHIQQTFLSRVLESVKVRSLLIYFTAFPQQYWIYSMSNIDWRYIER
jgi:hypothetical protein